MEEPRWMWPGRLQTLFTLSNKGPQTSKGRKAGRPKGAKTMTVFFPALFAFSIERKKTGVRFCRPRAQLPTIFPDKDCSRRLMAIMQGVSFERMMIFQRLLQIIQVCSLISCCGAHILVSCQVLGFPEGVFFQPVRDHAHPDLLGTNHL